MQSFLPLCVVIVEFQSALESMRAFLQLHESAVWQSGFERVQLMGMFEPDEEQKAVTLDKKEQQKLEDDFEKCDRAADAYLTKALPLVIPGD